MIELVAAVANDPRCNWDCLLGGKVLSRGRVNVRVEIHVRFSPEGPWHRQEHKVPRHIIIAGLFVADE
jgi:hypothetical protein